MNARPEGTLAAAAALTVMCGTWFAAQGGAPTLKQARAAVYTGIYDKAITLKGGLYEGAPFIAGGAMRPRVELIDPGMATGDVGGDGRAETLVLLSESSGGSGDNLYLAVLAADGGKIRNLSTVLVGNRVDVRSLAVVHSAVVMETVEAGPDDAMCCPTAKVRRTWTLDKGGLREAKAEQQGAVSLADLEGRVWTLTSLNWKDPLPAGVTVTAEFTAGKVAGTSGCNRYTAAARAGNGGQALTIGAAIGTRMACPGDRMTVEDAYLKALGKAISFTFMPGNRLALLCPDAKGVRSLVFVAAVPPPPR